LIIIIYITRKIELAHNAAIHVVIYERLYITESDYTVGKFV